MAEYFGRYTSSQAIARSIASAAMHGQAPASSQAHFAAFGEPREPLFGYLGCFLLGGEPGHKLVSHGRDERLPVVGNALAPDDR